ncbi:hypothetical protein [Ohtaekwangia sp.]|uniref:hypothetical protein n=1 Tax=Ohtaekwangia sp. TaxID=2066019 RepID=UPI002FDE7089
MKKKITNLAFVLLFVVTVSHAQDMQTVFKSGGRVTGYGALSNKFTKINGRYANIAEVYGGVYLNRRFMIGLGGGAVTNNIPVPSEYSVVPGENLSYEYGQCGLVTEYVLGSNKAFHLVFHLFSGAGFTVQYNRYNWDDEFNHNDWDKHDKHDENWFFVAEPGVQLEVNLFRWMRFSPGVSYRSAFGSDAAGLSDSNLSNMSYNVTLKFGRF